MKKLFLLLGLATFCAVSFTSCGKDSDELFKEPYLNFGATQSKVKSSWTGYTLMNETSTALLYLGKGNVNFYGYSFSGNALNGSMVLLKESITMQETREFIGERYQSIGSDGTYHMYMSNDGTMAISVVFDTETNNVNVIYTPMPTTKNSPENMFSAIRTLIGSVE
ncbi:MAG: hypothetical protein NC396_08020 [Bacteroides sp.]|nr:hypothetical protein [Bacteroides sp.]MCM1086279.1 hypothetical protein [Bacteroides sp.]